MKKVYVASKNPVKIKAAEEGFQRMFPKETFTYEGVSVPSGVSDQPLSNEETYTGALNRARNAQEAHADGDFWVGMEGGITDTEHGMESFAWMVVIGSEGRIGKARSATFYLPPQVAELIRAGKELGDADDVVFGMQNSKQKNGSVGILTQDVITRASFYIEALIFALIPFKNKELYPPA